MKVCSSNGGRLNSLKRGIVLDFSLRFNLGDMSAAKDQLLLVLQETRAILALPDNDFGWSSWDSAEDALREMDGIIAELQSGSFTSAYWVKILFAPTGSIQEVGLSSGWGDQFCVLAARFDDALAKYLASRV
jgi:hypothetical protein